MSALIVPSKSMKKSLEEATVAYQEQLEGSPGFTYLENRGITKEDMASYRLGFVSKPISGHHNSYIGWIVIPTITKTCVTSLRFRNLLRGKEKMYLGESGDITRPYNVLALSNSSPRVYITEGEFDAIIATGCGLPSVAMPGASSWKPEYAPLFRYRDTVVLADGDEPGLDFAKKLTQCIYECKIVSMPPGEDVSSFVFRHGKEALVRMVNS